MAAFSRSSYETLLYTLAECFPEVQESTLRLYPNSKTTAIIRGSVFFENGLELAAIFPHHYHEEPGIKNNRKPAPGISFDAPNLPGLIEACRRLGKE